MSVSQIQYPLPTLRKLLPNPRIKPWSFYDTGGEVIYYDDFSDGILRGAQNDDNAWDSTGAFYGGLTGITTVANYNGRCLHIRSPRNNGPFQDYNVGLTLSDDPVGSGIMPFIGMECKIGVGGSASSDLCGLSIERWDGVFTNDPRSRYECRVEYWNSTKAWRQVWDSTGSGGGVTGSTSGATTTTLFSYTMPSNTGIDSIPQPQEVNWTPVKLICDTRKLSYSGSLLVAAGGNPLGSLRVGDQYAQLNNPPTAYPSTFSGVNISDKFFKLELHVGTTAAVWADFYFADWIITRESGI